MLHNIFKVIRSIFRDENKEYEKQGAAEFTQSLRRKQESLKKFNGGYAIQGKGNLYYFIEWDTNEGSVYIFAENDIDVMIDRVKKMFCGQVFNIDSPVKF